MTYASALPLAFGTVAGSPFPALNRGMKLGDLIGQNKAAQVAKLGDLVPPMATDLTAPRPQAPGTMLAPPSVPNPLHTPEGVGPQVMGMIGDTLSKPSGMLNPQKGSVPLFGNDGAYQPPQMGAAPVKLGDLMQNVDPASMKAKAPKFFSKDGLGPILLGVIGDAIASSQGRPLIFAPAMARKAELEQERNMFAEKLAAEAAIKREERLNPRVEQVGNTLGMLNPGTQSFEPFFTAPQPFESYAKALGYEPGSPQYRTAVEDYRLGAWSDPAMENKTELEGVRQNGRRELLGKRLAVTRRGQDIRSADTRRGQNLSDARGRRGQDMTDRRVRELHGKKVGGKSVSSAEPMIQLQNGDYAVNRGGRWVSASTGQPVN